MRHGIVSLPVKCWTPVRVEARRDVRRMAERWAASRSGGAGVLQELRKLSTPVVSTAALVPLFNLWERLTEILRVHAAACLTSQRACPCVRARAFVDME